MILTYKVHLDNVALTLRASLLITPHLQLSPSSTHPQSSSALSSQLMIAFTSAPADKGSSSDIGGRGDDVGLFLHLQHSSSYVTASSSFFGQKTFCFF